MRMIVSLLMVGQLAACIRYPLNFNRSEQQQTPYNPKPVVEVSAFISEGRVVSAFVRHSRGNVLVHMARVTGERSSIPDLEFEWTLNLAALERVEFRPVRYEGFDESLDIFQDGRIVVVPLSEHDGHVAGVFVNLLSGDRYFFAPSVTSEASRARLRSLSNRTPGLRVILAEDRRADEIVARFPEFQF